VKLNIKHRNKVVYVKKRKDSDGKSSDESQSKKTPRKQGKNPLKIALTSEKNEKRKVRKDFFNKNQSDSKARFSKDNTRKSSERETNDDDRKVKRYDRNENNRFCKDNDRYSRRSEGTTNKPFRNAGDENEKRPYRSKERPPYERDNRDRNRREDSNRSQKPRKRNVTAESDILSDIIHIRHSEGRGSERKPKILSLSWSEERGPIRLNKYIANAGICSRRDADKLIEAGAVKVNGIVVTELGTKVMPIDEVRYEDKILQREKPVYILLNKPKDYITTTDDEKDRNHVMMLIEDACQERVYPVGRLDRNTTGLLLFTNDGEMAKRLTHPRYGVRKIYHVELDRNLTLEDFEKIISGIELRDGLMIPDEVAYVGDSKKEIGITIHSGKNRVVRRIFEQLGYNIEKLDRVSYASLTKKDVPRGHWRFLKKEEINILKMST
jgi:23S rRNA pseudouridine2605 synthase